MGQPSNCDVDAPTAVYEAEHMVSHTALAVHILTLQALVEAAVKQELP
jgi:hypothetical protein